MLIILTFSFYLRWINLEKLPYGIENDELSSTIATFLKLNNILPSDKGIWSLFNGTNIVFDKFNQLSFYIFGPDIMSPRKMLALTSSLALIPYHLFSRQFFSRLVSLLLLFLFSFSPYKLIMSRIPHGPVYGDLFLYPSLMLILFFSAKDVKKTVLALFFSGLLINLSIFNYNLAYTMPVMAIVTIFLRGIFLKIKFKKIILYMFIFLLPFIFSFALIKNGLEIEKSKGYAMVNSVYQINNNIFRPTKLLVNLKTIYGQFFEGLRYDTGDMFVLYSGTLINRVIVLLSIFGLFISIINFKKYYLFIIWFILGPLIYNLFLGIFWPRTWFLSFGLVYLLAGVTLESLYKTIHKFSPFYKLILILILFFPFIYYYCQYTQKNYFESFNNPAFLISQREIYSIAKRYKDQIGKKILFIVPELGERPVNAVYATVSFYYLVQNPNKAQYFKKTDRQTLGVIDKWEFENHSETYFKNYRIFVVDNSLLQISDSILIKFNTYKPVMIKNKYFTEIFY